MKHRSFWIVSFLFITFMLFLGSCSRTVEQTADSADASGLTMRAAFEEENGTPLSNCTVRFSDGENSADCQADQDGALTVSGLPEEGELTVTVLGSQEESRGTVTLSFSRGAVIDAVTDENAVGHVTLKEDTREIALRFTLCDDSTLGCALQLSEERIV